MFSMVMATVGCATSGEVDDQLDDATSDATAPGDVDVWESADGQWRFHVVAGNGRTMLASEPYATRFGALAGVSSVLDNGIDPLHYEVHETAGGFHSLHLVAGNHETIATTETYASTYNARRAIDACVRALETYLDRVETETGARVAFAETRDGGTYFNVVAQNGEVVLTSQRYGSRVSAWNGAFAAQRAAELGGFEMGLSVDGQFYFTLVAANHEVVGTSELYTSSASAENGIASVTRTLAELEIL
jgi:uncharacterized protein